MKLELFTSIPADALLTGKKLWLRPGTTWLLGRTKSETGPNERTMKSADMFDAEAKQD